MAEWPNASAWKVEVLSGTVGSNPTLSSILKESKKTYMEIQPSLSDEQLIEIGKALNHATNIGEQAGRWSVSSFLAALSKGFIIVPRQ